MSNDITGKLVLNVSETAKIMGISTKTVYEMCKRPDFPCVQLSPRRIGISRVGLERWIEAQLPAQEDKR